MKGTASKNHMLKRGHLRHLVPAAVWLMAVAVVVWLFQQQSQRFEILGIAQGPVRQVASNVAGRLKDVRVGLFDPVKEGQVVAVVDTVLDDEDTEQELLARLANISAGIEHLAAQLVPTQEDLLAAQADREANRTTDLRRFELDVDTTRLRILELKADIYRDRMTLEGLTADRKAAEDLVAKGAMVPYQLEKVKAQHQLVTRQVAENESLLAQAEANLRTAQQRLDEYAGRQMQYPSVQSALEVIHKAVAVREREMAEVSEHLKTLRQRQALPLASPLNGMVSQVWRGPGEAVTPGDPIVTIVQMEPSEIVGYTQQGQLRNVRENMPVQLVKTSEPLQIARSQVVYVGPVVEQMPAQLWRNPNIPQWGRPFKVKIPPGFTVIPGEVIGIRSL